MNSFNITNNSGTTIVIASLDNISIANGVTVDVFDSANGKFTMSDVIANPEIEALMDSYAIEVTDENDGIVNSLKLYFGVIPIKISPPQITVHVNDWNPTGFETASIINVDLMGIKEIKGMKAGKNNDRKLIVNVSAYELKLSYNDSGSLSQNRIWTVEQADYKIRKYGCCEIIYDESISMWRTIASEKN
jgi:hypothetical protein